MPRDSGRRAQAPNWVIILSHLGLDLSDANREKLIAWVREQTRPEPLYPLVRSANESLERVVSSNVSEPALLSGVYMDSVLEMCNGRADHPLLKGLENNPAVTQRVARRWLKRSPARIRETLAGVADDGPSAGAQAIGLVFMQKKHPLLSTRQIRALVQAARDVIDRRRGENGEERGSRWLEASRILGQLMRLDGLSRDTVLGVLESASALPTLEGDAGEDAYEALLAPAAGHPSLRLADLHALVERHPASIPLLVGVLRHEEAREDGLIMRAVLDSAEPMVLTPAALFCEGEWQKKAMIRLASAEPGWLLQIVEADPAKQEKLTGKVLAAVLQSPNRSHRVRALRIAQAGDTPSSPRQERNERTTRRP